MKAPESILWYEETNVLYNLTECTVNRLHGKRYYFKEIKQILKSYLILKCKILFNTHAISIIKLQKSKNLKKFNKNTIFYILL